MATISSLGVGSGLDINSLVSELVAAERAPRDARLTRTDSKLTTEFSALSALKGAMGTLQSAATAMRGKDALATRTASVSTDGFFSASATTSAVLGSYDVQVEQLATAARLGSAPYVGGADSVVGTGTLSFTVGTKTIDVVLTTDTDSLAQVRDAINSATGNDLVRATLVRDASGSYLVLTGAATGAASAITVSSADGDAGLQQLVSDLGSFDALRDVAAQDAIVHVSGYEIRSPKNVVSGAIDGVALTLSKATPDGETVTLRIDRDDSAIQKKAETFVSAFNTLAQQMTALGKYDAATKTAGPLLGDSLLRGLESQLRRMVSEPVAGTTGAYRTLSSIGISLGSSGALAVDAAKFQKALAEDPDGVKALFSSESGVAVRMGAYLDERLSATGEISARNTRISDQRRRLEQDKDALEARMLVIQKRYMKQFTAMDTLLSQMQGTSSYLTQQLDSLAKLSDRS